jgi:hypothetical protein
MVDSKLKAGSQCAGHSSCPSVASSLFEAGTGIPLNSESEIPSHGLTFRPLSGTVGAQWVAARVLCQSRCHLVGTAAPEWRPTLAQAARDCH